jgi:hypothetical protein
MSRVTLRDAQQALNDVMAQEPRLPETDRHALAAAVTVIMKLEGAKVVQPVKSFSPFHRVEQLIALLGQRIKAVWLQAQARHQAYWAEHKYQCAKGYLAEQSAKIHEWTQQLTFTRLQGLNALSLEVKMVYDVNYEDSEGCPESHTEIICVSAGSGWYRLVAWDMQVIDVVQISPQKAEDILSKVADAKNAVVAYEAASTADGSAGTPQPA